MTDDNHSRRTYLGIIGATGTLAIAGCTASGQEQRTLEWGGQGSENATLECGVGEDGRWKWVLTPGGSTSIDVDSTELTVTFGDGSTETASGFRPGGGEQGAIQFEVFKSGGGTVEDAEVTFSGGGDNVVLTISESECVSDGNGDDGNGDDGMDDDGMEDDGMDDDGMEDDGMDDDGMEDDGMEDDGMEDDGMEDDGMEDDGMEDDGADDGMEDDGMEDDGADDEDEDKKKKPDLEDNVDLKYVSKKDGDKYELEIHNDTDHDIKFSWGLDDTKHGGKVTVDGESSETFHVDTDEEGTVYLYHDGDQVDSVDIE